MTWDLPKLHVLHFSSCSSYFYPLTENELGKKQSIIYFFSPQISMMDEQGAWHLSLPLLGIDRIDSPKQWVRTVWVLKFKVLFSKLPSINSPSSFVPRVLPLLQLQAAGILAGFRAFLPSGGLLLGSVHGSEHQKFQTPSTEWSITVARSSQQRSLCHPKRCWERGFDPLRHTGTCPLAFAIPSWGSSPPSAQPGPSSRIWGWKENANRAR